MMRKRFMCLLALLLVVCSIFGCANPKTGNAGVSNSNELPQDSTVEMPEDLLQDFTNIIPDAVIHDVIREDMDGDGTEDHIILYTSEEKPVYAGVSVCLTDSNHSAVDLSGDREWKFSSKATVIWEEDVPIISVCLTDPADGTLYQYDVAYTYDSANKEVNYKISSRKK